MKIKQIMITGLLRTSVDGKMSKSAGNGLDPSHLHRRWGSDAIRYWAASCPLGADVDWNENQVEYGASLVGKLRDAKCYIEQFLYERCNIDSIWTKYYNARSPDVGYQGLKILTGAHFPSSYRLVNSSRELRDTQVLYDKYFACSPLLFNEALEITETYFRDFFCSILINESKRELPDVINSHSLEDLRNRKKIVLCQIAMNLCSEFYGVLKLLYPFMPNICEELGYKPDYPEDLGPYNIYTPPLTVPDNWHMGHIMPYVQIDIMARFKRLQGHRVYFPLGFDTNGYNLEKTIGADTYPDFSFGPSLRIQAYKADYRVLLFNYNISCEETPFEKMHTTYDKNTVLLSEQIYNILDENKLIYSKDSREYNAQTEACSDYRFLKITDGTGRLESYIIGYIQSFRWINKMHKKKLDIWLKGPHTDWCISRPIDYLVPPGVLWLLPSNQQISKCFVSSIMPLATKMTEIDLISLNHNLMNSGFYYTLVMQALLKRIGYEYRI